MTPPETALVFLVASGVLAGCSAALPRAAACDAGAACAAASVCLVGRCMPEQALPALSRGVRVVLAPRDMTVLSSGGGQSGDTIAVGGRAGEVLVLLRFSASYRHDAEVLRAFVVLDGAEDAPPAATSTKLEVARIVEPWASSTASWGRRPRLTVPAFGAVVAPGKRRRARVDVTELVRRWSKREPDDHGIAILATSAGGATAHFSAGLAHASGPALEVYLR